MNFFFEDRGHVYLFHTDVGDHQAEVHADPVDQPAAPPVTLEPEEDVTWK
jgi:hypothetical protein